MGGAKDRVNQRRLAVIDMGHDGQIAYAFDRYHDSVPTSPARDLFSPREKLRRNTAGTGDARERHPQENPDRIAQAGLLEAGRV